MEDSKVAVILEDLRSQFKVFGEGQADLRGRMIKVESKLEMLDKINDDLEVIKFSLKRKVDIEEFEALAKRVSLVEKKLLKIG